MSAEKAKVSDVEELASSQTVVSQEVASQEVASQEVASQVVASQVVPEVSREGSSGVSRGVSALTDGVLESVASEEDMRERVLNV